jgi:hypothetical protein
MPGDFSDFGNPYCTDFVAVDGFSHAGGMPDQARISFSPEA